MKRYDETREFFTSVYAWFRMIRKCARLGYSVAIPDFILALWESYEKYSQYTSKQLWSIAEGIRDERA